MISKKTTTGFILGSIFLSSITTLFGLTFLTSIAAAVDDVQVTISPPEITINTTETKSVDIVVTNNEAVADMFSLRIWPPTSAYVTPTFESDKIKVDANSNSTAKLFLTVSSDAEETSYNFVVTVKSINFDNISASSQLNVLTTRKTSIYVSDVSLDKYVLEPAQCVNVTASITNLGPSADFYKLQTVVLKGTDVLKKFDDNMVSLAGEAITYVSNEHCFDRYSLAGTYTISSTLRTPLNRLIDTRSVELRIEENRNLVSTQSLVYTLFAQIKTITIRNEGNIIEKDFFVTETVSDFVDKLFYPIDKPTSVERIDNKMIYSWKIGSLEPGKEATIKYEIRFVSIWFSGLAIAIIVVFAFSYVYKPKINKRFSVSGPLKRGNELIITLELKNSTLHELKNISVSDTIPTIASLVEKFDTMRPIPRKAEAGTELIWKIKSLRPLEERVLTYRIKPNIDITGSMLLPSATMEYLDEKKKIKVTVSKPLEVK